MLGYIYRHDDLNNVNLLLVHIDGLVQERRNSIVSALELRLSCTNPSIYKHKWCYLGSGV